MRHATAKHTRTARTEYRRLTDSKGNLLSLRAETGLAGLLDRLAYAVSPAWGKQRAIHRRMWPIEQARVEATASRFESANYDRLRSDKFRTPTMLDDDDFELLGSLDDIRDKCRQVCDNKPLAAGAVKKFRSYVSGTGMRPQGRITADDGLVGESKADDLNRQSEQLFGEWAKRAHVNGETSFGELQGEASEEQFEAGEAFILFSNVKDAQSPIPLKLQDLAPERIATPDEFIADPLVRNGIRHDRTGRITGYYVLRADPLDQKDSRGAAFEFDFIPAARMAHVYRRRRRRSRGLPELTPVVNRLQTLDDWLDQWLVNLEIASCYSVFITVSDDAVGAAESVRAAGSTASDPIEDLEGGRVQYLNTGEDVKFPGSAPIPATDTFAPFLEWMGRIIASGIGWAYELLMGDWSKGNMGSARLALLDIRRLIQIYQFIQVSRYLDRTWAAVLEQGIAAGRIDLPMSLYNRHPAAFQRVWWAAPPNPWADPLKEVQANMLAVEAGFRSRPDVCAELGFDWHEVALGNAKVEEWYRDRGLELGRSTRSVAGDPSAPGVPDGMGEQTSRAKLIRAIRNGHGNGHYRRAA